MSTLVQARDAHLLRRAVLLDAVASGAMGLLLVATAAPLSPLLGLPEPLLRGAGLVLIPYVAFLLLLWRAERITARSAWTVIAINAAWVLASFGLLASGAVSPTVTGVAFVIAQALAVLVFAELQFIGVKRLR